MRSRKRVVPIGKEQNRGKSVSAERMLYLQEQERRQNSFYDALTQEIRFDYTSAPPVVKLSAWGAQKLGLDEVIADPLHQAQFCAVIDAADMQQVAQAMRQAPPGQPMTYDCQLCVAGERRWFRITAMALWEDGYSGFIGKAIDIHASRMKIDALEQMAAHDGLTGLLNHAHAKQRIEERMEQHPDSQFALAIVDLDYFKAANDSFGHMFGDRVLCHMAQKLRQSIRGSDIAVRVGGDEFLIFLEYKMELAPIIARIFASLTGQIEEFSVSVSMGVAMAAGEKVSYEELFHRADQALYTAKQSGRGTYRFYDSSMRDMLSTISPIERT